MRVGTNVAKRVVTLAVAVFLLLLCGCGLQQRAEAKVREEFHKNYQVSASGSLKLKNVNGGVQISSWDRSEVEVNAVKTAYSDRSLRETDIKVYASGSYIEIETKNTSVTHWFLGNNPAIVEYEIKVPRTMRVDVATVNGGVEVRETGADVHVSTVNGSVSVTDAAGDLELSSVNGQVEGSLRHAGHHVKLSTVNGGVRLRVPANVDATIDAHTVNGGINTDLGIQVNRPQYGPGANIHSTLGQGYSHIELSCVNGGIELRKL